MSSQRKYRCPYCKKSTTRDKMPGHLERNHMDMLPEGFTPLRVTFHIVNNKPYSYTRPCRVCKGPTDWDEKKGRYNFLCNKKSCHDIWVKQMQNVMGNKMGSNRPTATEKGLEKMLASRKISGKYTFKDGGVKTYVGSYEKETLKFMDQVMDIKSEDVMTPGPALQYEYEGKKHYYLPDILYIPYNLIIEVKDGGRNPNTNGAMKEVRAKSIAKEQFIINHTNYNYLRLTDKDFSQLLYVFADLKMHLTDNDKQRVIHVNENAINKDTDKIKSLLTEEVGGIPFNCGTMDGIVLTNYLKNDVFAKSDYGIADSYELDNIVTVAANKVLQRESADILNDSRFTTYFVECDRKRVLDTLAENMNKPVPNNFIYETVFGHKQYTIDQIKFEKGVTPINDYYHNISAIKEQLYDFIMFGITPETEENKQITYKDFVKSDDGATNCIIRLRGYNELWRARSSMIILHKEEDKWYGLFNLSDTGDSVPGGGWDCGELPVETAIREAREEVRVNVADVSYEGTLLEIHDTVHGWVKEHVPDKEKWWYNYYTRIFVGQYRSEYTGKINPRDLDPIINRVKWYPIEKAVKNPKLLSQKEYINAIMHYIADFEKHNTSNSN